MGEGNIKKVKVGTESEIGKVNCEKKEKGKMARRKKKRERKGVGKEGKE